MSTITNKEIIEVILNNDGVYPGDPQCSSVWEYTNVMGATVWAIFHEPFNDIYQSPYVKNPVLLFDDIYGLTEAGEKYLKEDEDAD